MRNGSVAFVICIAAITAACETETRHETIDGSPARQGAAIPVSPTVADSATPASYLAAKAAYQEKSRGNVPRTYVDSAMKDLDVRLRRVIGPVSFGTTPGQFNLSWIVPDGEDGRELDAIRFGSFDADPIILVTNEEILSAWVRASGDTSANVFDGLAHEDVLTWALGMDAHATVYADVRKHASVPDDVPMALLITHSQDIYLQRPPAEVVVAVHHGPRVFLLFAAAPKVEAPTECIAALDAAQHASLITPEKDERAFLECYDRLAPQRPEFARVVERVRSLAALAKP